MAYETLFSRQVDLSKLGYGDSLQIDYDPEVGCLRVTIIENESYQDAVVLDLAAGSYYFGDGE